MKDDVDKLLKLYTEGQKADIYFRERLTDIIGGRLEVEDLGGRLAEGGLNRLKTLRCESEEYIAEWIDSVNSLLKNPGERVRFSSPNQSNHIDLGIALKLLPANARAICSLMDNLYDRNRELRIIIENRNISKDNLTSNQVQLGPAKYDAKMKAIIFAEQTIRFRQGSEFRPELCKAIFKEPRRVWDLKSFLTIWDSLADFLPQSDRAWQKIYDAVKDMNERIYKKTSIPDLFILSTTSVYLNPKYI